MPTRLAAETDLAGRVSGLAYFVYVRSRQQAPGLTITPPPVDITPTGVNPLYNTPLAFGLSNIGALPADPTTVADADLARVPAARWSDFGELAELKFLTIALNNFVQTNESGQDILQQWATLRGQFAARASELTKQLAPYLSAGKYRMGFARVRLPIQERGWPGEWTGPYGW